MSKTRKMVFLSLLVTGAMILSYIENSIPIGFSYLGAKLGLANIMSIIALYLFGFKEALSIVFLRTFLTDTLFGSMARFLFSISGGVLSVLAMFIVLKIAKDKMSIIGASVVGAVFHSIGQIIIASIIVKNTGIIILLPYLGIISVVTGLFVGISAQYIIYKLQKIYS
ncbi:Gx transporter family protein [Clostridiaceae bacterium M8S5]|nr:Gx transporter family protein [Clostridiaceae bacterium M8S5]